MTDAGLIKEILAKPFDDEPRLVYADWLEESGDVNRADFIRIQCECAGHRYWEPEYDGLMKQSEKLLKDNEAVWKKQLGIRARCYFQRGFIEGMTATPKMLLGLDPTIFSRTPIMSLQLSRFNPEKFQQVADSGIFKSILGLRASSSGRSEFLLGALNRASTKLRKLDLSGCQVTLESEFGKAIGQTPFAKYLTGFYLRACTVEDSFFKALGDSGGLPSVQRFEFGGGFEIARPAFFENLRMKKVRHLVAGGKFRVVDCEQLCHLPLKKLETISLRGTRPPAAGLKVLIEAGAFKKARRINLSSCNLSRAALMNFIENKAPQCTHLELAGNKHIDNEMLGQILEGKTFPKLKALHLEETKVQITKKFCEASSVTIVA